jgi:hypothetical protein
LERFDRVLRRLGREVLGLAFPLRIEEMGIMHVEYVDEVGQGKREHKMPQLFSSSMYSTIKLSRRKTEPLS